MNYADEPYVRFYTNDTVTWQLFSWQARTVLALMLKGKFDRSGVFEHGCHEPSRAVTAVTGLPLDITQVGVVELIKTGTWVQADGCIVWPQFVAAQCTPRTSGARKREERERNQAEKLTHAAAVLCESHDADADVTPCDTIRDDPSRRVTLSHEESLHTCTHVESETETETETETEDPPYPPTGGKSVRISKRKKPRTVMILNWQVPSELVTWCQEQGLSDQQIRTERDGFVDFWLGDGGLKADWPATFRNRIRSGIQSGRIKPAGATQQAEQDSADLFDADDADRLYGTTETTA